MHTVRMHRCVLRDHRTGTHIDHRLNGKLLTLFYWYVWKQPYGHPTEYPRKRDEKLLTSPSRIGETTNT